jgi:hypothetical protein
MRENDMFQHHLKILRQKHHKDIMPRRKTNV